MGTKYAVKITTKRESFYLRENIRSASTTPAGAATHYINRGAALRATKAAAERYATKWAWFAAGGAGGFKVEIVEVEVD